MSIYFYIVKLDLTIRKNDILWIWFASDIFDLVFKCLSPIFIVCGNVLIIILVNFVYLSQLFCVKISWFIVFLSVLVF